MFAKFTGQKKKTKEELRKELMSMTKKQVLTKGEDNLKLGLRLVKEMVENNTGSKPTIEVMEAFAQGILFDGKQYNEALDADVLQGEEVIGAQLRTAMTVGMLYIAIDELKNKGPIDHGHGGEPIFRKRGDGTPFCVVCDEDVTEEEVAAKK